MGLFNEANELYNNKKYEEAIDKYTDSILADDNVDSCYFNRAVCHIKLKDYNKAIEDIKIALRGRTDSKFLFNLGYCYAMLKQNKLAYIYMKAAAAANHDDADAVRAIKLLENEMLKGGN